MIIADHNGIENFILENSLNLKDAFQAVYFGHPNSNFGEMSIAEIRAGLGKKLVDYYGAPEIDIIVDNPDSGKGVTRGIAKALNQKVEYGLIKQAQAVRTFQEQDSRQRSIEVGLKFGAIDSIVQGKRVLMGDDSIVKGSVSEGGSIWSLYNSGIESLEFWISYGPMLFPSFKEWHRGQECLLELAVQRAFKKQKPLF